VKTTDGASAPAAIAIAASATPNVSLRLGTVALIPFHTIIELFRTACAPKPWHFTAELEPLAERLAAR
jgi:hypothetical protein